jgi:hypothetical protein
MQDQPTLAELKRLGDKAFAEAQATIDKARQIIHNSMELNAEVRRTIADFKELHSPSAPIED